MSIQLAPNATATRSVGGAPIARDPKPSNAPRVLASARTPAQLSFIFKR